ncbi:MATE family efflux transporter [Halorussus ruber]|uniref:MATE family efflux transporter n=1 Tax=Halorussus ruber TaxID=1126238 RepID=UPI00109251F1|nr:MATE family efflux transporter [Halorussus ruber]
MLNSSGDEITDGSLKKSLAIVAIPIVAQHLALSTQLIIDVFWLGRLSSTAVAAVGLIQPVVGLLAVSINATASGVQILVSQRLGADDPTGARRITIHGMALAVSLMATIALFMHVYALDITQLFNASSTVTQLGATYLSTLTLAYIVTAASDTLEAGFVGAGDSRTPLIANLTAIGVNAILDPFLILGWGPFPKYGIAGAPYATLAGYVVGGSIIFTAALSTHGDFSLTRTALQFRPRELAKLLRVGGPQAGQRVGRQTARLCIVAIISMTGSTAALTAYTVGARIATIVFVPAIGIGQGATTLVGQNLGADQPQRATRATWLGVTVGTLGLGSLGVIQWLFPTTLAHMFVPGISGQTLTYSVAYLQILAYGYWALGAIYTVSAGFNGAGRTEISMYAVLLQYWAIRVPVAAIMAFVLGYGAFGPFWAVTISNIVAGVGLTVAFYYSTTTGMLTRAADTASNPAD